jgi:hypothetical protein
LMSESSSSLVLIAALVSLIPGAYFLWMVIKGFLLSIRRNRDDDL